jgi:hypothetical protein
MSLYNLVKGVNPATFFILPMLDKHPDDYPRFRDCFVSVEHVNTTGIIVYTRTGGGNREFYAPANEVLKDTHGFIFDFDDPNDGTFAYWIFEVPEQWKADYELIMHNQLRSVSKAYQDQLRKIYPKLNSKWDELFGGA